MERKHKHRAVRWLVQGSRWVSGGNTHSTATWPPLESTEYQEEKEGVASFYHGGFSIVLDSLLRLKPLATNQSICSVLAGDVPGGRKYSVPATRVPESGDAWAIRTRQPAEAGGGRACRGPSRLQTATHLQPRTCWSAAAAHLKALLYVKDASCR